MTDKLTEDELIAGVARGVSQYLDELDTYAVMQHFENGVQGGVAADLDKYYTHKILGAIAEGVEAAMTNWINTHPHELRAMIRDGLRS